MNAEDTILQAILHVIDELKQHKPNDRTAQDRTYAIAITEAEKLYAYFLVYATYATYEA